MIGINVIVRCACFDRKDLICIPSAAPLLIRMMKIMEIFCNFLLHHVLFCLMMKLTLLLHCLYYQEMIEAATMSGGVVRTSIGNTHCILASSPAYLCFTKLLHYILYDSRIQLKLYTQNPRCRFNSSADVMASALQRLLTDCPCLDIHTS